jgi:hypothetical protein
MIDRKVRPLSIERDNLSLAWGEALLALLKPGVKAITPLTVSITGHGPDGPAEIPTIRSKLERLFVSHDIEPDVETVAFTIFPEEYWQLADRKKNAFFDLFKDSFPRMQDWRPRENSGGMYFQRLIDFYGDKRKDGDKRKLDQLSWIIEEFRRNPGQRASQFQATTYDPERDRTRNPQPIFPCLQQLSFVPLHDGTLVLNAFYATQQVLRKGYGNYLGLSRLGLFMGKQMGLKFARLNVFVGVAKMDRVGKSDAELKDLAEEISIALSADMRRRAA